MNTPGFYGVVVAAEQQHATEFAPAMVAQLRANQGIN